MSKDQHARNKFLPLALIEDRKGHFDRSRDKRQRPWSIALHINVSIGAFRY